VVNSAKATAGIILQDHASAVIQARQAAHEVSYA
jgi:hypothetical protein